MENIGIIADIVTTGTIIITIFALFMTRSQIKREAAATISSNHLEIKKLFSEESRNLVHMNLRPGGIWCSNNSGPKKQDEWIAVEDYLGLFEMAEFMLKKKTLDENLFKRSFFYRLENIKANKIIMDKVTKMNEDWDLLIDIFKRYKLIG